MSDIDKEIQHQEEKTPNLFEKKEALASGKASLISDKLLIIPDKTPGKEIAIRPRSPYREINMDANRVSSSRGSATNPENSVRIEESNSAVRSVYEIGGKISKSPIFNSGANTSSVNQGFPHIMHHQPPNMSPNHYHQGYFPPPPPGYTYYPIYNGHPPPPPLPRAIPHAPIDNKPDYKNMPEDLQQEARIIFKSKFASLREIYKEMSFDEYDPELPLSIIHDIYEKYLKKITIESNTSFTRIILIFIFYSIEAFCIRVLNLDITGYTKNQIASMKRYDRLLLELGEKYSSNGVSNWPIEVRLIGLALFNAFVIIFIKFFCDKIGAKDPQWFLDVVNNMIGGHVDSFVETKPDPKIDPITNTIEVPKDNTRDLMGGVQNLLAMAGSTLGGIGSNGKSNNRGNNDIVSQLGNIGATILENANNGSKSKITSGLNEIPLKNKVKGRGVKFGNRDITK